MFSKFSKEQLEKLAFYSAGINAILVEALLSSPEEPDGEEQEVGLEIHIVETDKSKPQK